MTGPSSGDASAIQPGSARAWVLAARPKTLPAAIVPVAVGSACAFVHGGFAWPAAFAAALGALWIQVGTNLANDVFDHERGADTPDRLGPTRAVAAGLLTPGQVRYGMVCAFGLATLCGLYLVHLAGWPILVVGVASILAGIGYTGGPFPLAYNGLGDVFVLLFFGFVAVCGTAFVHLQMVPLVALWASLPVGLLATAMLVVNNIRDAEKDKGVGKKTLAVLMGRRLSQWQYKGLLLLAYLGLAPVSTSIHGGGMGIGELLAGDARWIGLPIITLPYAMLLARQVGSRQGEALNSTLAGTAQLLLLFGALLSLGLVLSVAL